MKINNKKVNTALNKLEKEAEKFRKEGHESYRAGYTLTDGSESTKGAYKYHLYARVDGGYHSSETNYGTFIRNFKTQSDFIDWVDGKELEY